MNYFHWQKWLRECGRLDMKCWAVGEMFRKSWEYLTGRKLLPCPSLFQWSHLYPTLASHCRGLNLCTIFISGIPICDVQLLSFQFIFSTTPTPVYLWAPAGTKIHWSYFSLPLTPLTLSLFIWLCSVIHHCHLSLGYTPLSFSHCVILIWQNPHLVPSSYISLLSVLFLWSWLWLGLQPSQLLFSAPRPQVGISWCPAV